MGTDYFLEAGNVPSGPQEGLSQQEVNGEQAEETRRLPNADRVGSMGLYLPAATGQREAVACDNSSEPPSGGLTDGAAGRGMRPIDSLERPLSK